MSEPKDAPNVIAKPPILYAAAIVLAAIIEIWVPINLLATGAQITIGLAFIALSLALGLWAFSTFKAAETNIPTNKPATTVVSNGPYRFSRNPIYIALTGVYIGVMISFDVFAGFLVLIPLLWVMNRFVIAREETYLENKFGQDYLIYKTRVRRWL